MKNATPARSSAQVRKHRLPKGNSQEEAEILKKLRDENWNPGASPFLAENIARIMAERGTPIGDQECAALDAPAQVQRRRRLPKNHGRTIIGWEQMAGLWLPPVSPEIIAEAKEEDSVRQFVREVKRRLAKEVASKKRGGVA